MSEENKWERCGVCEKEKERGIHLYTMFICTECEQEMIHTDPSAQKYQYFLEKMRVMNQTPLYS
ncbi:sigma factor G inhibitor Gin [Pontibacillus yanchengensis]|uniref:Sigma factor G inhibitor Gin n=1 Tax=Pontibacillus yanchengensis TaxID=462910 RepID=A0A6I5A761_9BACI|nr:sigma factor G inhibitor Gin [Pontibacillus yanchengensis]MYL36176.1 sigma factor G inhibitor Gin [Pontibacillus yanchengensis]